jgi:predicted amidophosphoribosyltransferase
VQATVDDYTNPYLETFVPVPPVAPGVCAICHGAPNPGYRECYSCAEALSQVSRPVTKVVPITLCDPHGPMYQLLRDYKRSGYPELEQRLRLRMAALLGRFVATHQACLGDWDVLTTVPSTGGRQGPHPLVGVVSMVRALAKRHRNLLGVGAIPARHRSGGDGKFTVVAPLSGQRVLLVDDLLTSGARLQSAGSALRIAGATVVAAVVVGRFIKPTHSESSRGLWARAAVREFNFDRCCLCDEAW